MADLVVAVCYCGHKQQLHGNQKCVGTMADGQKCDCEAYIPVLAAIAQSLNALVTQIVDLKHVVATVAGLREAPKRIIKV